MRSHAGAKEGEEPLRVQRPIDIAQKRPNSRHGILKGSQRKEPSNIPTKGKEKGQNEAEAPRKNTRIIALCFGTHQTVGKRKSPVKKKHC